MADLHLAWRSSEFGEGTSSEKLAWHIRTRPRQLAAEIDALERVWKKDLDAAPSSDDEEQAAGIYETYDEGLSDDELDEVLAERAIEAQERRLATVEANIEFARRKLPAAGLVQGPRVDCPASSSLGTNRPRERRVRKRQSSAVSGDGDPSPRLTPQLGGGQDTCFAIHSLDACHEDRASRFKAAASAYGRQVRLDDLVRLVLSDVTAYPGSTGRDVRRRVRGETARIVEALRIGESTGLLRCEPGNRNRNHWFAVVGSYEVEEKLPARGAPSRSQPSTADTTNSSPVCQPTAATDRPAQPLGADRSRDGSTSVFDAKPALQGVS